MEKLFQLKANGTTVRTELLAGLTTFMTMAYIIALNPNLLTNFAVGTPLWNGVFLATCIASAIGTICMAFLANKPFVMAPGMGLNSFFAVVVANIAVINECEYETAFQAALVIILVEGIVFLILTLLKVREKIVEAIPLGVRYGIAPAIGLMLMNVGLGSNVGIYAEGNGFASPFYMMRDFFGALTPSIIKGSMGEVGYHTMVLTVVTAFLGVFVMVVLAKKGVKAAVLLGMLFSSVIYWAGSAIFLWPAGFVLPNALRAANDVRFTMLTSILSMGIWRLAFSYILCVQMGMGAVGVWIAMVVDWVCRVTCFVVRFVSGAWKKKCVAK